MLSANKLIGIKARTEFVFDFRNWTWCNTEDSLSSFFSCDVVGRGSHSIFTCLQRKYCHALSYPGCFVQRKGSCSISYELISSSVLNQKQKLTPYVVQHWNVTYHYTSDNDIPACNVVGTLLFPHTAMYYYTRGSAPPPLHVWLSQVQ